MSSALARAASSLAVRRSSLFIPTLREAPAEATLRSHQLLIRGGYARQCAGGIYMLLPLGLRVVQRIEALIDEEMAAVGAQKLQMPLLLSSRLWKETGRWESTGEELFRLKDRRGADYCLGPTHEELFTELVASSLRSYRELPLCLYQVGQKYRDEVRPRFGLLRAREFVMKDAYSFHESEEDALAYYDAMDGAYRRVFERLGAPFARVEADGGNIGGSRTHEFQILSDAGEDTLLRCDTCRYASNAETAVGVRRPDPRTGDGDDGALAAHLLMHAPTGAALGLALAPAGDAINPVALPPMIPAEGGAALLADDVRSVEIPDSDAPAFERDANAAAALDACAAALCGPASSEPLAEISNFLQGGPRLFVDAGSAGSAGADDLEPAPPALGVPPALARRGLALTAAAERVEGLRAAQTGDGCAQCGEGTLTATRGIEVGQIFFLGDKYSERLGATFVDRDGRRRPAEMGCYGIGVTRIVAALLEAPQPKAPAGGGRSSHAPPGAAGVVWPDAVAPYAAAVVTARGDRAATAEALAEAMAAQAGRDAVVLDDRWKDSLGKKLSEADLVGYPVVVVVGRDAAGDAPRVEVRDRARGTQTLMAPEAVPGWLRDRSARAKTP
jgi:prolyl-tRNA synthetase